MSAESPLLCALPMAGRRCLLHWWTGWKQGQVILAADEAQMAALARAAAAQHADAKLREACEIDLVAPSRRMQDLAAWYHRREEVAWFHQEVAGRMKEALAAGLALPAPFARCTEYRGRDGCDKDVDAEREHWWCANCRNGIRLAGTTPAEFHDAWRARWEAAFPPEPEPEPRVRRRPSEALPAGDDEPVWHARADFGHHQEGVVLEEVQLPGEPQTDADGDVWAPGALGDRVLFRFRRLREIDLGPLRAELEAARQRRAEEAALEREAVRSASDRQDRLRLEAAVAVFTSGR
jgi:hypothetical protein